MTFYVKYDHTATGPTKTVAFYDTSFVDYPGINFTQPGFLEISEEEWACRMADTHSHVHEGRLVPKPEPTAEEKAARAAAILKAQAEKAFSETHSVITQFAEEGHPVSEDWRNYRRALRAAIAGTSTDPLPAAPPVPDFG
jgi:hypothetical protein